MIQWAATALRRRDAAMQKCGIVIPRQWCGQDDPTKNSRREFALLVNKPFKIDSFKKIGWNYLFEGSPKNKVYCLPFLAARGLENQRAKCNAIFLLRLFGNSTLFPLLMTTQLLGKNCDGGHYTCSPPKDCCKQGCCFLLTPTLQRPPTAPPGNLFAPHFLSLWYFWVAVMATVAGILCACSLWKKHSGVCCKSSSREERPPEPDSGSCYAPPQYSRCNSFHQPPPYSEVTSKPDLYPLVINYNGDPIVKNNNGSTGYIMVQYFRNFIVRPVGSLSATSTIDSISSSFICNAANEANTVIPPPYSCMGSLEEVTTHTQQNVQLHEAHYNLPKNTSNNFDQQQPLRTSSSVQSSLSISNATPPPAPSLSRQMSIRDNPCFGENSSTDTTMVPKDAQSKRVKPPLLDSVSQDSDAGAFADLLNLSLCMTGSDISSLGNLGTPDSPPRATTPTLEIRELLGKIQRLPLQQEQQEGKTRRAKAKTLYVPLREPPRRTFPRCWLSRSAPGTPCGPAPAFQGYKRSGHTDGRPLLREQEESEEERFNS